MNKKHITLLSPKFLVLVEVLQSHDRLFMAETKMAEVLGLNAPEDHMDRSHRVFHEVLGAEFINAGVQMNDQSFQALLSLEVSEEVLATPAEKLPEKFAFASWLHHGKGGIFEIIGRSHT